ncbi:craniofacial development protein 2-like [Octopus sinensis]|uniref:Craniofacial development protein 2-like n=1 Tax=Octopus sinensis TaxID=2607531 RepID=A0A6P7SRM8_9MOLL|nr:craniofacial development protein 2-like [Octopus sinensis]
MCPGIIDDLRQMNDSRKTAVINTKLKRLNIDIAALQETRLAADGMLREKDYTFYWQGRPVEEARQHGVGFAVRNSLLPMVIPPSNGSERILTLNLATSTGKANIISAYAPTLYSPQEIKDRFYEELDATISQIPESEPIFLLGDFNARVGSDHGAWPDCLGRFGVGRVNENGQRLLELCSYRKLCVSNTFFMTKPHHQVSWRHPRSGHWHQLDMVITW